MKRQEIYINGHIQSVTLHAEDARDQRALAEFVVDMDHERTLPHRLFESGELDEGERDDGD